MYKNSENENEWTGKYAFFFKVEKLLVFFSSLDKGRFDSG